MPKGKGPKQDIAGKRFGRLVAVRFDYFDDNSNDCWLFHCDCGNEKVMPAARVKWGRVRSCGCLAAEHIESLNRRDIAGKRYGRLTAVRPTDERDAGGSIVWECVCECGNIVHYSVSHLTQGRTKSCGCLFAESRSTCSKNRQDAVEGTILSALVASKELRADNTSGHTGVCYNKKRDSWLAYINFQGKRINLGYFKDKAEAIRVREAAASRLHDPLISEHWHRLSKSGKEKWRSYSDGPAPEGG